MMSGDDDNKAAKPPERTVFMPTGPSSFPPTPPPQGDAPVAPPSEPPAAAPSTPPAFSAPPQPPVSQPPESQPVVSQRPYSPPLSTPPMGTMFPVGAQPRPIQIGDVLNHIFEVKRFIARGGMGEVFEGANINSDERVAIKVMLPNLAADPNVQAMFRKEARTLTRLTHPSLVQYRVLAQEPNLGVFYIVTEYVDGQNLSDVLRDMDATPEDLVALTKRLADGLKTAHSLGAIHRDISPDNVMLEGGKLAGAKIIDFGIAKDLDPGSSTIVGDGFAGKLNYVAPEQLGDFDRSVGPWTDVYSLGLLILAVASKRDVDMGGTLVDAVDKRRAGPDISAAPDLLRPVLEKMLKPNPADRLRSMGDVLDELRALGSGPSKATKPVKPPKAAKPDRATPPPLLGPGEKTAPSPKPASASGPNKGLIAAGAAAVLVLGGGGLWYALSGSDVPAVEKPVEGGSVAKAPVAPPADPVATAQEALKAGLPAVACTWLDVDSVDGAAGPLAVALRGVAGKPAEAQAHIGKLLESRGIKSASIDFADVSPIESSECGALDTFRQVRDPAGGRMVVAQRQFEMKRIDTGEIGGQAVIDFNLGGPGEISLFGLEPSGRITAIAPTARDLKSGSTAIGNGSYRLTLNVTHKGWSGLLLLSGARPIDAALVEGPQGSHDAAWSQRFLTAAGERQTKAEMVWFQTVDQQPN